MELIATTTIGTMKTPLPILCFLLLCHPIHSATGQLPERDWSPPAKEEQLPRKMRSATAEAPRITVGHAGASLLGTDNRALQAAVDYVAGLGGGIVEIGPGEYLMRDSLHLRPQVIVRRSEERRVGKEGRS